MGLDVGDRRIGVAVSDPAGILATPMTIIEYHDESVAIKSIVDIIQAQGIEKVISGLPRAMNGSVGHQAGKVQAFISRLMAETSVPVEYRDERLTSVSAKKIMKLSGKVGHKEHDDAVAAALILQSYLDETLPDIDEFNRPADSDE